MAIQQFFPFSKAQVWALSAATALSLASGSTAVMAQTQTEAQSKPLSNSEKLLRGSASVKRGAPGRRFGGGSRSVCALGPQAMAMVAPADNVTVTTSAQPNLMLWVNQANQNRDLEFVLRDSADELVYRKVLKLSNEKGLVSLDMSQWDDAPRLNRGDDYYYYMSLICDVNDRSKDIVVEGVLSSVDYANWLSRESKTAESGLSLESLSPIGQVEHYMEIGLWHDAMVQLNHLRQSGETVALRQQAQRQWQSLLEADTDLASIVGTTTPVVKPIAIIDSHNIWW